MNEAMESYMPLRGMLSFGNEDPEAIGELLRKLNHPDE